MSSAKDTSRDSRLSYSNAALNTLRTSLKTTALKNCTTPAHLFAQCAKQQGFMVVFKCRDENRAYNECLGRYTSEEEMGKLMERKMEEVRVGGGKAGV